MGRIRVRAAAVVAVVVVAFGAVSWVQTPAYADSSRQAEQQAERLRQQARTTAGGLAAAQAQLSDLAARANAALDTYQRASEAARAALATEKAAERELAAAVAAAADQRRRVGVYVTNLYRRGGADKVNAMVNLVSAEAPQQVLQSAGTLKLVGQRQSDTLTAMTVVRLQEQQARAIADQAAFIAHDRQQQAGKAKKQADALMAAQQTMVLALQTRLDRTQGAARAWSQRAGRLAHAEAVARQRARAFGSVGSCKGRDVSGYPNGRIPESALCPLWGAPGHRLRADAANGFNKMSRTYAAHFGSPICVTDSYRSYAEQVRLKEAKPDLAATPGTSNHGWGLATDLCGGIQTDGTATNTWLRQNAGRFGWFHPSWGDPGGSGPYEPWHWEYAGGQ
ncbi:MAG: peptidoglycan DL-endopeptidase CwlO [Frankiales bacterium]|jgi:hypothetical protein|nr:peptidoglycan DL-endopeptidase CwlO [Frankiales bacterium]